MIPPAYPFSSNQSPAAIIAAKTNDQLLPAGRKFLTDLITAGIEWTANDMMGKVAAAEADGLTTVEGWDTNDIRIWNHVFNLFLQHLNTPQEIPQRGEGNTITLTPQDACMRYYNKVQE